MNHCVIAHWAFPTLFFTPYCKEDGVKVVKRADLVLYHSHRALKVPYM